MYAEWYISRSGSTNVFYDIQQYTSYDVHGTAVDLACWNVDCSCGIQSSITNSVCPAYCEQFLWFYVLQPFLYKKQIGTICIT
jgi:hypothetical protein